MKKLSVVLMVLCWLASFASLAQASEYTVKNGDSPWKIAFEQLHKGSRWTELRMMKDGKEISNPRHLKIGTILIVPETTNQIAVAITEEKPIAEVEASKKAKVSEVKSSKTAITEDRPIVKKAVAQKAKAKNTTTPEVKPVVLESLDDTGSEPRAEETSKVIETKIAITEDKPIASAGAAHAVKDSIVAPGSKVKDVGVKKEGTASAVKVTIVTSAHEVNVSGAKKAVAAHVAKDSRTNVKANAEFEKVLAMFENSQDIKESLRLHGGRFMNRIMEYLYPGRNKFRGTSDLALMLLAYPANVQKLLAEKIANKDFKMVQISRGQYFLMISGKDSLALSHGAWKNEVDFLGADEYSVEVDGIVWKLWQIYNCRNWARPPENQIKKEEAIAKNEEEITQAIVNPITPFIPWMPPKPPQCRDYEFSAGTGLLSGSSGIHDLWGYSEGMIWDSCWYWSRGIGFYLKGDNGNVPSHYEWDSFAPGLQAGLRYQDFVINDDGTAHPYGITAKLRLILSGMSGKNPDSGYSMSQRDLMLGLYLEYVRELRQGLIGGISFEGWLSLLSSIDSTWSGDSPSNQARIEIRAFLQKKLSEDWQLRGGISGFFQFSDESFGLGPYGELRYDEWLMPGFGLYFLFPGVVYGPSVRAEVGNYFRKERDKQILNGIWAVDESGNKVD